MNWLYYLLEANLYLCVFYAGYCLFLNRETHYTLNRLYLLFSCVISFILPVIQIGALKPAETGHVIATMPGTGYALTQTAALQADTPITFNTVVLYVYLTGAAVLGIILLFKLFQLAKMIRIGNKSTLGKYRIIYIEDSNTAFSFFNYLFIGTKTTGTDIIINHELVHIKQKHSADIVFIELMKIINWFNPFIYLLQVSLKTVHEYIADEQTAALETDAISYSSFLVDNAYGLNGLSITHSFFNYNLLKKRIIMLNQKRSGNLARLKYLVAVPMCGAMLCASTLVFSKTYGVVDLIPAKDAVNEKMHPILKVDEAISTIKPASFAHNVKNAASKTDGDKPLPPPAPASKPEKKPSIKGDVINGGVVQPMAAVKPSDVTSTVRPINVITGTGKRVHGPIPPPSKNGVYKSADILPEFPGGEKAFVTFLVKNVKYPAIAAANKIQGTVILNFIVEADGSIADIKVARGIGAGCDEEAIRAIKKSPKWKPGMQNGKAANVSYTAPISFRL